MKWLEPLSGCPNAVWAYVVPDEGGSLVTQLVEWSCYLGEVMDKSPVIGAEPKETAYLLAAYWDRPVPHGLDFFEVGADPMLGYKVPKKLHFTLGRRYTWKVSALD